MITKKGTWRGGRWEGEKKDGDKEKRDFTSLHMFSLMELQFKSNPYGCLIEAKDLKLPVNGLLPKKGNQALGTVFFWPKDLQSWDWKEM